MPVKIPDYTSDYIGPIIIIGFGSIGSALLPLICRHFPKVATNHITIIDPDDRHRSIADQSGARFIKVSITKDNYETVLAGIQDSTPYKHLAFIINVANEVSSEDLVRYASKHDAHYLDTVVEPWPGFYFNRALSPSAQSNYALRESLRALCASNSTTPTAISCCGANPGMVSWLLKEALLKLAADSGKEVPVPATRTEWAHLMRDLGVKGVHIAERDTQISKVARRAGEFVNTWSISGFLAEGLQPAELGWGTHEQNLPEDGQEHKTGSQVAIYLKSPGAKVKVSTWTPTAGAHFGYLITHNEAMSISDYFTLRENDKIIYRPTCHYAYHPTDATVAALDETMARGDGKVPDLSRLLTTDEITGGADELGVLLYGHDRGVLWYGSRLTIEEARELAPFQNATGLQVSSGIIAGMFYALAHPNEGLIEADEMDHAFCLNLQRPYLGTVFGTYSTWRPEIRGKVVDPWQFSNFRLN